jgi:hypothetical protein
MPKNQKELLRTHILRREYLIVSNETGRQISENFGEA